MNLTLEREGTLPFFKIYPKQDLLLFLIKKELHETKMMLELNRIGLINETLFVHDLGDLILSLVGIKGRDDELWQWYYSLIDSYAKDFEINNRDSVFEQSCRVYFELIKKGK